MKSRRKQHRVRKKKQKKKLEDCYGYLIDLNNKICSRMCSSKDECLAAFESTYNPMEQIMIKMGAGNVKRR